MKNRFNNITSKEWLPFQKSWFKFESDEEMYRKNIRFFCKVERAEEVLLYYGSQFDLFSALAKENGFVAHQLEDYQEISQFIFVDLRAKITDQTNREEYEKISTDLEALLFKKYPQLSHRRFISVLLPNIQKEKTYYPFAWDLAKRLGNTFSLKDEKIACVEQHSPAEESDYFSMDKEVFYCLYLRKDEKSAGTANLHRYDFFENNTQLKRPDKFDAENKVERWFILKPQPRNKKEILHPAKYPEDLVHIFVKAFTRSGDNVFDPMAGTGSTQLGALQLNRNAYGTEFSKFFEEIAQSRCSGFIASEEGNPDLKFKILHKDAALIDADDFPTIDYLLTSPPYWDMLNMKGAENQAKRIKKGLQTNYSEDPDDLGNIEDYHEFLRKLRDVYFNIAALMKPGAYMTIVVKNIKKKGSNYPFAWDLSLLLQEKLILLPEAFWCQDDIRIAPYGYGNTFVSNTFHHYCLNFQVPHDFKK